MRTDDDATSGRDQAPRWRKSHHSNPSGNCVEIATVAAGWIGVRTSRHPSGGILVFTQAHFRALLDAAATDTWGSLPSGGDNI
jgi:hypothetical protein